MNLQVLLFGWLGLARFGHAPPDLTSKIEDAPSATLTHVPLDHTCMQDNYSSDSVGEYVFLVMVIVPA